MTELLAGCDFTSDPDVLAENTLFNALVDGIEDLTSSYAKSLDWSIHVCTAFEQFLSVDWNYRCALLVLLQHSCCEMGEHLATDTQVFLEPLIETATCDNPYLRYYSLSALIPLIRASCNNPGGFGFEVAVPSLIASVNSEYVMENQQLILEAIAGYCKAFKDLRTENIAQILGFAMEFIQQDLPPGHVVCLVDIIGSCASDPEFAIFAESVYPFFDLVLRDHLADRRVFFRCLEKLPKLRRFVPGPAFDDLVGDLLDNVCVQPLDFFNTHDRDSVNKFVRRLIQADVPVVVEKFPVVLSFVLQTILQPLEVCELDADDVGACYTVFDSSIASGKRMCYATAQLDDAQEAFHTLCECLGTANSGFAECAPELLEAYLPWLSVPFLSVNLSYNRVLAGLRLIPYLQSSDPSLNSIFAHALESLREFDDEWALQANVLTAIDDVFPLIAGVDEDLVSKILQAHRRQIESLSADEPEFEFINDDDWVLSQLALSRVLFSLAKSRPGVMGDLYVGFEKCDDIFTVGLTVAALAFSSEVADEGFWVDFLTRIFDMLKTCEIVKRRVVVHFFTFLARERRLPGDVVSELLKEVHDVLVHQDDGRYLGGAFVPLLLAVIRQYPEDVEISAQVLLRLLPVENLSAIGLADTIEDFGNLVGKYLGAFDDAGRRNIIVLGRDLRRRVKTLEAMTALEAALNQALQ
jgi:hypothetical protein